MLPNKKLKAPPFDGVEEFIGKKDVVDRAGYCLKQARRGRDMAWSYNMTMSQFNLAKAKAHFSELVQRAMLGEDVVVTKENKPVVKIVPIKPVKRKPGTGKGIWMATDFDAPLDDFQDYM